MYITTNRTIKKGYFSKIGVWILLWEMLSSEKFTYERIVKIKKKVKKQNSRQMDKEGMQLPLNIYLHLHPAELRIELLSLLNPK